MTIEMRRLGHTAFSCDLMPCSGGYPEWHIQSDVLPLINGNCEFSTADGVLHKISGKWDMIIGTVDKPSFTSRLLFKKMI